MVGNFNSIIIQFRLPCFSINCSNYNGERCSPVIMIIYQDSREVCSKFRGIRICDLVGRVVGTSR